MDILDDIRPGQWVSTASRSDTLDERDGWLLTILDTGNSCQRKREKIMARYTHFIRVPFTGSLMLSIKSDDPEPSAESLYEMALDQNDVASLKITDEKGNEFEIDEWSTHDYVIQGNGWFGVLDEVSLDETIDEDEDEDNDEDEDEDEGDEDEDEDGGND